MCIRDSSQTACQQTNKATNQTTERASHFGMIWRRRRFKDACSWIGDFRMIWVQPPNEFLWFRDELSITVFYTQIQYFMALNCITEILSKPRQPYMNMLPRISPSDPKCRIFGLLENPPKIAKISPSGDKCQILDGFWSHFGSHFRWFFQVFSKTPKARI